MKKKVKKTTKARLSVFGTLSILVIIYFGVTLFFHIYTIYDLTKQRNDLEKQYERLKTEADELQIEINKLNDPDYLARYAREKYSYSKEGEFVIKMSDTKKDVEIIDDKLNINYVVISLSSILFLVFVYIIFKSKKKKYR